MSKVTIPESKRVQIFRLRVDNVDWSNLGSFFDEDVSANNGRITRVAGDIPMVLEEDISLTMSSTFDSVFGGHNSPLSGIVNSLGAASASMGGPGFGSQFKQFGMQTWKNSAPLSFSLNIGFYKGGANLFNAFDEVYKPTLEVCALPLPAEGVGGSLVAPGPTMVDFIADAIEGVTGKEVNMPGAADRYTIKVGKYLNLQNVLITKATPTFSNETDDTGYPIWSKIQMDITTTFVATVQMLESLSTGLRRLKG